MSGLIGRRHTGRVSDAPAYRIWPPVALGVPLLVGIVITATAGDPVELPVAARAARGRRAHRGLRAVERVRVVAPGPPPHRAAAGRVHPRDPRPGPVRRSRNPLYLGLIALDLALALLWPSFWAVVLVPVGIAALRWGAVLPEERYLSAKFGAEYDAYRHRTRRWC